MPDEYVQVGSGLRVHRDLLSPCPLCKELQARLDAVAPALRMAFQIAEMERWNDRFPKIFGVMSKALGARDE